MSHRQEFVAEEHHFPVKRLLLLGALVGAGAYYLSREQNRKALDQKLSELGLKDAAENVGGTVSKGWEKTKDAAASAGHVLADKAGEVKEAVQQGGVQAGVEKAKEVAGEAKVAVKGAAAEAGDAAKDVAGAVKAEAPQVHAQVQGAAKDAGQQLGQAAEQAKDRVQQTAEQVADRAQDDAAQAQSQAQHVAVTARISAHQVGQDATQAAQETGKGVKDGAEQARNDVQRIVNDVVSQPPRPAADVQTALKDTERKG